MTELPSPSPYAYLDALPPSERLSARRLQEHRREDPTIALARRARDLQAELAEAKLEHKETRRILERTAAVRDTALENLAKDRSERDSLRTMCAELIEAGSAIIGADRELGVRETPRILALRATLTRARKLLEGGE